jgi:hypothetical protein
MRKKINKKKLKNKILVFWVKKKKGLGLTRFQFNELELKKISGVKVRQKHVSDFLRQMRKERLVIYRDRRWFLKEEFYCKVKEVLNESNKATNNEKSRA